MGDGLGLPPAPGRGPLLPVPPAPARAAARRSRRRGGRALLAGGALALVAALLAAVGLGASGPVNADWRSVSAEAVAAAGPPPAAVAHDCPFDAGHDVECGTLVVPLDRAGAGEEVVELAFARLRATGPAPAPDPVVYLEGGPGGFAVADWGWWFDEVGELLVERDVILLDQRGVGFSHPSLVCTEQDEPRDWSDPWAAEVEVARACHARLVAEGHDLSAYSTRAIAADVADLRRALDLEAVNLLGVSYGTRVALAVLRDAPEGVRSVVLDSVYPLDVAALEGQVVHAAAAFDEVLAGCAADGVCAAEHPDLALRLDDLVEGLEAEPVVLPGIPLWPGDDWVVDGEAFVQEVFHALYAPGARTLVPAAISAASDGDVEGALDLLAGAADGGMRRDVPADADSDGLFYSVTCREEGAVTDPAAAAAAAAAVREPLRSALAAEVEAMFEVCGFWDAGVADAAELAPAASDVPTLVLAGAYDPITPRHWGERVAGDLGATYVEFPDLGHAAIGGGPCQLELVREFLADPHATVDVGC